MKRHSRAAGGTSIQNPPVSVILVKPASRLRARYQRMFSENDRFRLMGVASSPQQGMALLKNTQPDICVLGGVDQPLKWLRRMKSEYPNTFRVWICSRPCLSERIGEWIRAGVQGCLLKEWSKRSLELALPILADKKGPHPRSILELLWKEVEEDGVSHRDPLFSPGQRFVAKLFAQGLCAKDIAMKSGKSFETIRAHLKAVFREVEGHSEREVREKLWKLGFPRHHQDA